MIKTLDNFSLIDLIPENLKRDPDVAALAEALTPIFIDIYEKTALVKMFEGLPSNILDYVAFEETSDFYDSNMTDEQKREMISKSQYIHKTRGTVAAVEEVASVFFKNPKVVEWFDYNGKPYNFRIETQEPMEDENDIAKLFIMTNKAKNVRSRLEEVWILSNNGARLRAIENKNKIIIELTTGGGYAGVWPYYSTEGTAYKTNSLEIKDQGYYTSSSLYRFASEYFSGNDTEKMEILKEEYLQSIGIDLKTHKSLIDFIVAREDLYFQFLTGQNKEKYEQETRINSSKLEASGDFYKSESKYTVAQEKLFFQFLTSSSETFRQLTNTNETELEIEDDFSKSHTVYPVAGNFTAGEE